MPTLTDSRSSVNKQTIDEHIDRQRRRLTGTRSEQTKLTSHCQTLWFHFWFGFLLWILLEWRIFLFSDDRSGIFTRFSSTHWVETSLYQRLFSLPVSGRKMSLIVRLLFSVRCAMENDERNGVWMECEYACSCVYRLHAPILVFIFVKNLLREKGATAVKTVQ